MDDPIASPGKAAPQSTPRRVPSFGFSWKARHLDVHSPSATPLKHLRPRPSKEAPQPSPGQARSCSASEIRRDGGHVQGGRAADSSSQCLNGPNPLLTNHSGPGPVCQRPQGSRGDEATEGRGATARLEKQLCPQERNGLREDLALRSTPGPQLACEPPCPQAPSAAQAPAPQPGTPDPGAGQLLWGRATAGSRGELLLPTPH